MPLNIGGKSARFEALLSNKVPAAILDPPYTTMAAKEGYNCSWIRRRWTCPICAISSRFRRSFLREDSRTVSRFVAALAEGMQFNRNKSNKEESIKILAKYLRMPLEKNRAMIEEGYESYRDMMLKKPYADSSAMKILIEMIAEANPKARNINVASLVDSSFVGRLEREGAFDRSVSGKGRTQFQDDLLRIFLQAPDHSAPNSCVSDRLPLF